MNQPEFTLRSAVPPEQWILENITADHDNPSRFGRSLVAGMAGAVLVLSGCGSSETPAPAATTQQANEAPATIVYVPENTPMQVEEIEVNGKEVVNANWQLEPAGFLAPTRGRSSAPPKTVNTPSATSANPTATATATTSPSKKPGKKLPSVSPPAGFQRHAEGDEVDIEVCPNGIPNYTIGSIGASCVRVEVPLSVAKKIFRTQNTLSVGATATSSEDFFAEEEN